MYNRRLKNPKLIQVKLHEEETKRAELDSREQEVEGQHSKEMDEMLPAAQENVDMAEDEVEKVAIAAPQLQIEMVDDVRAVMLRALEDMAV